MQSKGMLRDDIESPYKIVPDKFDIISSKFKLQAGS